MFLEPQSITWPILYKKSCFSNLIDKKKGRSHSKPRLAFFRFASKSGIMLEKTNDRPIQSSTPIRFSDKLSEAVDVVVIGGGVIGIFSALYLRELGYEVAVCEKGRVAGEQSSRNWGWIRQHGRDPAELPIMIEANRLWGEADRHVKGATGFKRAGVCYLASSQARLDRRAEWLSVAREHQLKTRVLSAKEVAKLIDQQGDHAHHWVGGVITENDARAEPWRAVPAIAELASSRGVMIQENCAVRALDIEAGRIQAVETENGRVRSNQVVLAAGAWSALFARRHGVRIPQLSVGSTVVQTAPMPEVFAGNAADEKLAFRRRADGGYTLSNLGKHDHYIGPDSFRSLTNYLPVLKEHMADTALRIAAPPGFPDAWGIARKWEADRVSPFERMRVLNPAPNPKLVRGAQVEFAKRFPALGTPEILNSWAGMIDTMPDVVPVVDRVPNLEGLIIATGMSGHGFGIGPGFGKIIANMVAGRPVGHDISRFRFARFSDGSRIIPGPSI